MDEGDQEEQVEQLGELLDAPHLAQALESDRFKQFLDHLPIAIAVSEMQPMERIVYANPAFADMLGPSADIVPGKCWNSVPGQPVAADGRSLGEAITAECDFLGAFTLPSDGDAVRTINAWSNLIEDDDGTEAFRLVALIGVGEGNGDERESLEAEIRERDTLLQELQHRVKNNLQMITALIRMEARQASDDEDEAKFDRLAGRVEALALLYDSLSHSDESGEVDLGTYLSQIASAAMKAQATEGLRLELLVDAWPVSINVAMPTGLVVNELMTNALKYAFRGRENGTIRLECTVGDSGCTVLVADDGIGLPDDVQWPEPGKLSALIVRSLRDNARAELEVESRKDDGTKVTIRFAREAAAPA